MIRRVSLAIGFISRVFDAGKVPNPARLICEGIQMTIRIATIDDTTQLLEVTMRFASEFSKGMSPPEKETAREASRLFYLAHLNSPFSRTWVAVVDERIVAVGTLAFFVRPAFSSNPAAIEAYFLNMYTLPEHRRRGFASEILTAAKLYAQSRGITKIWLHATEAGRPVYEAAGFQNVAA
jgi:GNAT superfamily N-acetyltransferase